MALAPRNESSFSLRIEEQHCPVGHGDKHVHAPDAATRRGPASRRHSTRLAQATAITLTLLAASAFAGEHADAAPTPPSPTAAQGMTSSPAGTQDRIKQLGSLIVLGAVSDPRDADWVDDSALPELPVIGMDGDAQDDAAAQPGAARLASGPY